VDNATLCVHGVFYLTVATLYKLGNWGKDTSLLSLQNNFSQKYSPHCLLQPVLLTGVLHCLEVKAGGKKNSRDKSVEKEDFHLKYEQRYWIN